MMVVIWHGTMLFDKLAKYASSSHNKRLFFIFFLLRKLVTQRPTLMTSLTFTWIKQLERTIKVRVFMAKKVSNPQKSSLWIYFWEVLRQQLLQSTGLYYTSSIILKFRQKFMQNQIKLLVHPGKRNLNFFLVLQIFLRISNLIWMKNHLVSL